MPDRPSRTGLRPGPTAQLRADCARCAGLCCVAPAFAASADFAVDKPAGAACPNLRADFRCGIHDQLRPAGFAGCAAYDCFGAGQQVTQVTFGGRDWRREPALAPSVFATFTVMRQLHELLWYLTEALALAPAAPVHPELRDALARTSRVTGAPADELAEFDLPAHRRRVTSSLRRASELVRGPAGPQLSGADLVGADRSGADLRAANLRGAHLIATNLTDADLRLADLTGADTRAAILAGADLTGAIFVTQAQIDAARGDLGTRLPASVRRPAHWLSAVPG